MRVLTEDLKVVKAALAKPSKIIVFSDDFTRIRRKNPLPEARDAMARTLYVKGFPQTATLDELQEFFAQHSQTVEAIRFRRHKTTNTFKGSVFVEFSSEEEANKFASLDLSYGEQKLVSKKKMAYFTEKNAEIAAKRAGKSPAPSHSLIDKLVKVVDVPNDVEVDIAALKEVLKDTFPVGYIDLKFEESSIWIRFRDECASKFVEAYADKPLEVGEYKFTSFTLPSEEEMKKYEASIPKANGHKKDFGRNKRQKQSRGEGAPRKRAREEKSPKDEAVQAITETAQATLVTDVETNETQ